MFKNIIKTPQLYAVVLPLQIFGILSIYIALETPNWYYYTLIGYICIMMLGISGCYHRLICHKGYTVNNFIKRVLLWFGILGGQGSPIFWCMVHRRYHHRHTDKEGDLHSPIHGLLHSYILWQFKLPDIKLNPRDSIDLFKDNDCVFIHNHYIKLFYISNLIFALISFNIWMTMIILPAFIAFHSFSIITSLSHIQKLGYKNYKTDDNSINCIWLFPILLGDAWHNNHHGSPKNPNYQKRWFELDPTYLLIKLIKS